MKITVEIEGTENIINEDFIKLKHHIEKLLDETFIKVGFRRDGSAVTDLGKIFIFYKQFGVCLS